MIFSSDAKPLLDLFKEAGEAEGVALREMIRYMNSGGNDNQELERLSDAWQNQHNKKMELLSKLQAFRIDK